MALDAMSGGTTERAPWTLVTAPSRTALLSDIRDRIARGTGFSVATLNLDHAVKLRRDPDFREAYAAQTHVTADGQPIVWLSRLAGRRVDLITGSDLVDPLTALCAELRAPVAMLGSTEPVLAAAARQLRMRYPDLEVAALLAPPMGFDPYGDAADELLKTLSSSGARVCFLALGAPKQEKFAARALRTLGSVGFVSVGAGLDFIAGAQTRAPRLVRSLALEWLWRLLGDPRRLAPRYATCAAIMPSLALNAVTLRMGGGKIGPTD